MDDLLQAVVEDVVSRDLQYEPLRVKIRITKLIADVLIQEGPHHKEVHVLLVLDHVVLLEH